MITIKRLNQITFEEATQLWNEGFSGYDVNLTMSVDSFTNRFGLEGLSPSISIAAFVDNQLAGFVLSGTKMINGKRIAWNGGTGVVPEFRKKGIGKVLIQSSLDIYREDGVDIATLEVLTHNIGAIKLYEQMGYIKSEKRLLTLQHEGIFDSASSNLSTKYPYQFRYGTPMEVENLSFCNSSIPWESMWQNTVNAQSLFILDANGDVIGYALFKSTVNQGSGNREFISLYQCEVKANHPESEDIVRFALSKVFAPSDFSGLRTVGDFTSNNEQVVPLLLQSGFVVKYERYLMNKKM